MQADVVRFLGDRLALHVYVDAPWAGVRLRVLERYSRSLGRRRSPFTISAGEGRVAADEIHLLLSDVAEVDEDALRRIPAKKILVEKAIDPSVGGSTIIVVADILAEQAIIVAQSVRKTLRPGVEQNEGRVQRRCIHEHDARLIIGYCMCLGIDDAHTARLASH